MEDRPIEIEQPQRDPRRFRVHIRALVDNLTTLNATLMKGQSGECPIDRAKLLVGQGKAVIVEGELDVPGVGIVRPDEQAERTVSRSAQAAERRRQNS